MIGRSLAVHKKGDKFRDVVRPSLFSFHPNKLRRSRSRSSTRSTRTKTNGGQMYGILIPVSANPNKSESCIGMPLQRGPAISTVYFRLWPPPHTKWFLNVAALICFRSGKR